MRLRAREGRPGAVAGVPGPHGGAHPRASPCPPRSDDATRALQDAPITTVNILLLAALADPQLASLIPVLPYWDSPSFWFPQRTPHDILFGYVDPQLFDNVFPGLQPNDTSLEYALGKHSKSRMATGKGDPTRGYEYIEWSGGPTLQCCDKGVQGETGAGENCHGVWQSYDAAAIAGVFGTAFHTAVDPSETLQLATYDFGILRHWPLECANVGNGPGAGAWRRRAVLCAARAQRLAHARAFHALPRPRPRTAASAGSLNDGSALTAAIGGCDAYVVQDVSLLKFALPVWALGNASVSPDEAAAYNITGPSGLLDVATCEQNAPIRLSLPHFLHGSNSLRDALTGLADADEQRHGSWLGVEPMTGQVLDFQFRVQINAGVKPVTVNTLFVDHTFFKGMVAIAALPIAWGEQQSTANANQGAKFRSLVYTPVRVAAGLHWGGWTLVAVALLGAAVVASRAAGYCGGSAAFASAAAASDGYARAIGDYDDDATERRQGKKAALLAGESAGAELPPRGGRGGLRL